MILCLDKIHQREHNLNNGTKELLFHFILRNRMWINFEHSLFIMYAYIYYITCFYSIINNNNTKRHLQCNDHEGPFDAIAMYHVIAKSYTIQFAATAALG